MDRHAPRNFDSLNEECRPEDHILDTSADQVVHSNGDMTEGSETPPKSRKDELKGWINTQLNPRILGMESDSTCALVFTEGSQKKTDEVQQKVSANALSELGTRCVEAGLDADSPHPTTRRL